MLLNFLDLFPIPVVASRARSVCAITPIPSEAGSVITSGPIGLPFIFVLLLPLPALLRNHVTEVLSISAVGPLSPDAFFLRPASYLRSTSSLLMPSWLARASGSSATSTSPGFLRFSALVLGPKGRAVWISRQVVGLVAAKEALNARLALRYDLKSAARRAVAALFRLKASTGFPQIEFAGHAGLHPRRCVGIHGAGVTAGRLETTRRLYPAGHVSIILIVLFFVRILPPPPPLTPRPVAGARPTECARWARREMSELLVSAVARQRPAGRP